MQIFQGIAVSPGIAIGEALVIDNQGYRIARRHVARAATGNELRRLDQAIAAASDEIHRHREAVNERLGEQYGAIFSAHLALLNDGRLRTELEQGIAERNYSAEYSVRRTLDRFQQVFNQIPDGPFAERANDLVDIEHRLLRQLLGKRREDLAHLATPMLVLAHNLTPSETAQFDRRFVLGFATETGGAGGHTAIVAEALEIPAVVGAGSFLSEVSSGDLVIVDGDQGRIILQPDEDAVAHYRRAGERHRSLALRLRNLNELPCQTADGTRIELCANIEFPHELESCLDRGADGIGLYRTEFLYLATGSEPAEEVQYEAYSRVVRAMQGRPVVIRTLDLGADKLDPSYDRNEKNPFLGLRSIRLSLRNLTQFRTQIRAALRASALGDLRLMFPLISTVYEMRQARMVVADVMEDLDEEGLAFNRDVQIGMMVEVPSAVVMLDRFAEEADFFSIGTNDLIQYALAVDRTNPAVAPLYSASDPAVLRLLKMTLDTAQRTATPVCLCGQMSGGAYYSMLLLGLGLRSLSVAPGAIPEIKQACRAVTIERCRAVAERALELDTARDVDNFLREELRKLLPEAAAE